MDKQQRVLRGMALAFFGCAYADLADEYGSPLSGQIMDQLPGDIDPACVKAAERLYTEFEQGLHNAHGEDDKLTGDFVYEHGVSLMGGATLRESYELFGHYAAMQAMGHGVGLDDYAHHSISDHVPYFPFSVEDLELDYILDIQ